MKLLDKINSRPFIYIFILFLLISIALIMVFSFNKYTVTAPLSNVAEVEPGSELTYYIDVGASGSDRFGTEDHITQTCLDKSVVEEQKKEEEKNKEEGGGDSEKKECEENSENCKEEPPPEICYLPDIKTGYLFVKDIIPEGLIFNGFEQTLDGTIGAYSGRDEYICDGYVVDDSEGVEDKNNYHGLHYDETTRTVSFMVKNLQAGCTLTVGVKTIVPEIDDSSTTENEIRRDFYNTAYLNGYGTNAKSNTVHAYSGEDTQRFWSVTYEFEGDVPQGIKYLLPPQTLYVAGSKVATIPNIDIEGYEFSGWESNDVEITNNIFTMPSKNIVIKGRFRSISPHKVTYEIDGIKPLAYTVPTERNFYTNSTVKVEGLKEGETIYGYRFLGWKTEDVEISKTDLDFLMPSHDVTLTGTFEVETYKVEYKFEGEILPPNSEDYLPPTLKFTPGEKVTLENVISPDGFKFLGWNKERTFEMPKEDIVVYGEWIERYGQFSPEITNEIVDKKDRYKTGEKIKYKVTITNTAPFGIKEIIIKEHNEDSYFVDGEGYIKDTDHFVTIPAIKAGEKIEVFAEYVVKEDDTIISNTVEIMGALNDNNYELNTDVAYLATIEIERKSAVSTLKLCKKIKGASSDRYFQFNIKSTTNDFETSVKLKNDECRTLNMPPDTYTITEIMPAEYQLEKIEGAISSNGDQLEIIDDENYEITYTNVFKKKGFLHSFGTTINEILQGVKE